MFLNVRIYHDFTLHLSCKHKLYYKDARCLDLKFHNTDYLSDIFSERKAFKGKLRFQSTSGGMVFFTKTEDHNYAFRT